MMPNVYSVCFIYRRPGRYHYAPHQFAQVLPDFRSLAADLIINIELELGFCIALNTAPVCSVPYVHCLIFSSDLMVDKIIVKDRWYVV